MTKCPFLVNVLQNQKTIIQRSSSGVFHCKKESPMKFSKFQTSVLVVAVAFSLTASMDIQAKPKYKRSKAAAAATVDQSKEVPSTVEVKESAPAPVAAEAPKATECATPKSECCAVKPAPTVASVVSNLDWHGSASFRYENINLSTAPNKARMRYELLLGSQAQISDKSKLEFSIATGKTTRSLYQTTNDPNYSSFVRFQTIAFTHQLCEESSFTVGKMINPIWTPTDTLWDKDVTLEGFSFKMTPKDCPIHSVWTAGYSSFGDLQASGADSLKMEYIQAKATPMADTTVALTFYNFENTKGNSLSDGSLSSGSKNTIDGSNKLVNEFKVLTGAIDTNIGWIFDADNVRLYGEGVTNLVPSQAKNGGTLGFKFGNKKVTKSGQWLADISYRYIERDAWIDVFPESAYADLGSTGVQGTSIKGVYGIADNVAFSTRIFFMETLGATQSGDTVIQCDLKTWF